MVSGNPNLRNDSAKGYDVELLAGEFLKTNGYEVLYDPERMKRQLQNDKNAGIDPVIEKKWNEASEKFLKARKGIPHAQWNNIPRIKKAKDEFYRIDALHQKELELKYKETENMEKKLDFITSIIGKSLMPKQNYQEWKKLFDKSNAKNKTNFKVEDFFQHIYIDYFCKKGKNYYIFDIKHKTFKENTDLNRFYVTNYEVLNYNKIQQEKKVKLKIMIILEKTEKLFYKIFDWSDFVVPSSFDPHTRVKTSIKLKEGFDNSNLKEFKTIKLIKP